MLGLVDRMFVAAVPVSRMLGLVGGMLALVGGMLGLMGLVGGILGSPDV